MANVHTFGSMNQDSNRNQGQNRIGYAPLDTSQPSQQSQATAPMFSFGFRNPDGTFNSVNCLQAFFPEFTVKSFIFVVTMLQVLVFLTTEVLSIGYEDSKAAFNCTLYQFGGKFTPAILIFYHVHRLILPILLHAGFGHIFFNMLSQWLFGFRLEKTYGFRKFVTLYLLAGLGGNLLSAVQHTDSISVGASSSLFGIFAFQIAFLIENYENLGPRRNIAIIMMVLMIFANVDMGTQGMQQGSQGSSSDADNEKKKVDNSAHLGGFIVGALISILFIKYPSDPNFHKKQRIALILLAAYFVITSVVLATLDKTGMEVTAEGLSQICANMQRS